MQRPLAAIRAATLLACLASAACTPDALAPTAAPRATAPRVSLMGQPITDGDAIAISDNIAQPDPGTGLGRHVPYGIIADPEYASGAVESGADFTRIVKWVRIGDGAIWTGHWLAAEAFRYKMTGEAAARANLQRAVDGIEDLSTVTTPRAPDLLARAFVPTSIAYMADFEKAEGRHGLFDGTVNGEPVRWIGNTSRDQYVGAFFGMAVAFDMLDPAVPADAATRAQISGVATRLLKYLLRNGWSVKRPDGTTSTTFVGRADQQLALAQIGRRVNPKQFDTTYVRLRKSLASSVINPLSMECTDPYSSYFKFNLDYATMFNLVRLEEPTSSYRTTYLNAYNKLRSCTATHDVAHFNVVDRALRGPSSARDADTRRFLELWLLRPRRDYEVNLTGRYAACGTNRACSPVPVNERPNTDFLWQRSPFTLMSAGGLGTIETSAIDFILPYWMARFYGVPLQ
jgi:hypothetical protein